MSYSRFSNADVYVFDHAYNGLYCCGCWLDDVYDFIAGIDVDAMIKHLDEHRNAGHNVPDFVYEGIEEDREYFEKERKLGD